MREDIFFEMSFPDESFDIIWAEGSIYLIGFERGLMEWRQFIKPNRFLVVHKMTWLRPEPPQEISDYWMELYPGIRKEKVKIYDNSWPGGVWEVEPEIVVATAAAMTGSVRVDRGNGKTLLGKGFGGIENDEYNVVFWKSETE